MKINLFTVSFKGKPDNYLKIDNVVSRSAQPGADDFIWLKNQGVTDIVNFRTMVKPALNFDEKKIVEQNGMRYHNIPSITKYPDVENINKFLKLVDNIKKSGGKVHIHCKAGADRTGMYSFIYKQLNNLGNINSNTAEMLKMGHNYQLYPDLLPWIKNFLNKFITKK